ncbi:hypothetical protein CDIK_2541 [Cucumispora dikerogammari]|nr:hypothetical protein CDIK_2541 [Cucumispora dikerogammari]
MNINKRIFIPIAIVTILTIVAIITYLKLRKATTKRLSEPPTLENTLMGKYVILKKPIDQNAEFDNKLLRKLFGSSPKHLETTSSTSSGFKDGDISDFLGERMLQFDNIKEKSFENFKHFVSKETNIYREKQNDKKFEFKPNSEPIEEPIHLDLQKEDYPLSLAELNIIKTNCQLKKFLKKYSVTKNKDIINNLLSLTSADSINKLHNLRGDKSLFDLFVDYGALQFHYFGMYRVTFDESKKENILERVYSEKTNDVFIERSNKRDTPEFDINLPKGMSGDVNLQNVLWGIKKTITSKVTKLTFPILLNAPPFLTFNVELNKGDQLSLTFPQSLLVNTLEEKETLYFLTGVLWYIYGDEGPATFTSFCKHDGKWKWFDGINKIERDLKDFDFQTKLDTKRLRIGKIFYSRDK